MKKFLAMILAAMMMFGGTLALAEAEEATTDDTANEEVTTEEGATELPAAIEVTNEPAFEGSYAILNEDNYAVLVPNEWYVVDITEEQAATGVVVNVAADEEQTQGMNVIVTPSDVELTTESIYASIATLGYANMGIFNINGMDFVAYDVNENVSGMAIANADATQLIVFSFAGTSDPAFTETAMQIVGSLCQVETTEDGADDEATDEEAEEATNEETTEG